MGGVEGIITLRTPQLVQQYLLFEIWWIDVLEIIKVDTVLRNNTNVNYLSMKHISVITYDCQFTQLNQIWYSQILVINPSILSFNSQILYPLFIQ